jgi:hypothetical protein
MLTTLRRKRRMLPSTLQLSITALAPLVRQ